MIPNSSPPDASVPASSPTPVAHLHGGDWVLCNTICRQAFRGSGSASESSIIEKAKLTTFTYRISYRAYNISGCLSLTRVSFQYLNTTVSSRGIRWTWTWTPTHRLALLAALDCSRWRNGTVQDEWTGRQGWVQLEKCQAFLFAWCPTWYQEESFMNCPPILRRRFISGWSFQLVVGQKHATLADKIQDCWRPPASGNRLWGTDVVWESWWTQCGFNEKNTIRRTGQELMWRVTDWVPWMIPQTFMLVTRIHSS